MPPAEVPLACTLTATEMPKRLADMRAIGADALLTADLEGRQAVLRFRQDDAIRRRLESIVAAEAQCCAFLDMTLADAGGVTALTITAPVGAEPVLAELAVAFGARAATMPG